MLRLSSKSCDSLVWHLVWPYRQTVPCLFRTSHDFHLIPSLPHQYARFLDPPSCLMSCNHSLGFLVLLWLLYFPTSYESRYLRYIVFGYRLGYDISI
jgi:hypothetical protein